MPSKAYLELETAEQREKRLNYNRKYNQANSEHIRELMREHLKNSETYRNSKNRKISCDCGSITSVKNKAVHQRSLKHLNWTQQNTEILTN